MKKIGILAALGTIELDVIEKVEMHYIEMVAQSGFLPFIIPHQPALFDEYIGFCDGFVLVGGSNDCDPSLYNSENTHSSGCNKKQDEEELLFLQKIKNVQKPCLGVCRGLQLMNIFEGGTLCQDVKNRTLHLQYQQQENPVHSITVLYNPYISVGTYMVNSVHHQSIDILGENILPFAHSEDGIIEGIIHKKLPWVGVQWHPEFGFLDQELMKIFKPKNQE